MDKQVFDAVTGQKCRQTKTSTTKMSTNQNIDKPIILYAIVQSHIYFHNSWNVLHVYPYIDIIGGMYCIY